MSMDVVSYELYPLTTWDEPEAQEHLKSCAQIVHEHVVDYIWHREPFRLRVAHNAELQSHQLIGTTYHGENVDDEWFISFLLCEISKKMPHVVCRVHDSDGDILLIEAANALPKWLTPESAVNRVFLRGGKLHIIPMPSTPADIGVFPVGQVSLSTALKCLGPKTEANASIQKAVLARVGLFPLKAKESIHRARCYVPEAAAKILKHTPQLIAAAVTSFYERDQIAMRACSNFEHFLPQTRVMAEVQFTRCLYAQLISQRFQPSKHFGSPPSYNSVDYKAFDLGAKLTYGLEMLVHYGKRTRGEHITPDDLKDSSRWASYVKRLQVAGYFKENIEGSAEYKRLLEAAQAKFIETVNAEEEDAQLEDESWSLQKAGRLVIEELQLASTLPSVSGDIHEDSDAWLDVSPEELDRLLEARQVNVQTDDHGHVTQEEDVASRLSSVTQAFQKLLNHNSSHEGAEVPAEILRKAGLELDDLTDDDDGSDEFKSDEENEDDDIDFNAEEFVSTMRSLLEGIVSEEKIAEMSEKHTSSRHEGCYHRETVADCTSTHADNNNKNSTSATSSANTTKGESEQQAAQTESNNADTAATDSDFDDLPNDGLENLDDAIAAELREADILADVELDTNLLENLLKSYAAQEGMAGPASSILQSLHMRLPDVDTDK